MNNVKALILCNNPVAIPGIKEFLFYDKVAAIIVTKRNKEMQHILQPLLIEKNVPLVLLSKKEYQQDNKEIIKEKRKIYYDENKEKFKIEDKKYREEHKDEILTKLKNKVICEICNKEISLRNLNRHKNEQHNGIVRIR